MDASFAPFHVRIRAATGILEPPRPADIIERRLSDMRGMYQDAGARLADGDPVLYRVYPAPVPDDPSHLLFGTTVIEPGRVGDEYFMTKGHYHAVEATGEVYHCLAGRGCILMETRDGRTAEHFLEAGGAVYIPPGWAHRSVNVADVPFGFRSIVVARDGRAIVAPNPRFA